MTDDDKIAMAREAGFPTGTLDTFDGKGKRPVVMAGVNEITSQTMRLIDAAYAAGVREGRERAAKIAAKQATGNESDEWLIGFDAGVRACTSAIRQKAKE